MRVVAVILNWRRADLTLACLRSVQINAPQVTPLLVDNASGDGSCERLTREAPEVELLVTERNRGYAGGNLAGGQRALEMGADAILILNNDVTLEPGCAQALISAAAADPRRGIIAPLSLDARDTARIDFHTASLDLATLSIQARGRGSAALPVNDQESDYAPGSALLIRREAWEATGGFDERFFLVWEDVDLSLRVVQAGYKRPLVVSAARVLHEGSSTFGGAESARYRYYLARNAYLLADRHRRGPGRLRTRRLLNRRFEGWARSATDPAIADALRLGAAHGRAGRFGPGPDSFGS